MTGSPPTGPARATASQGAPAPHPQGDGGNPPPLESVGDGHYVACHRARELSLRGVPDLDELPVGG